MAKKVKVKKAKPSKLKTGLKIAGAVAGAVGLGVVGKKVYDKFKKKGGKGRKKSAGWYARQIVRLKLKRKYDKLRLSF